MPEFEEITALAVSAPNGSLRAFTALAKLLKLELTVTRAAAWFARSDCCAIQTCSGARAAVSSWLTTELMSIPCPIPVPVVVPPAFKLKLIPELLMLTPGKDFLQCHFQFLLR